MLARWRHAIDPTTINTSSVKFWRITSPPIELSLASAQMTTQPTDTILITPSAPLSLNTTYGVFFTNNVREYSGMPATTQDVLFSTSIVFPRSGNLATRVTDEGPIWAQVNPSHDRWNVLETSRILVQFNEPVNPATVSASNFRVWETRPPAPPSGVAPAGTFAVPVLGVIPLPTPNSFQLDLDPSSVPFNFWSTYVVAVDNRLLDAAGNHGPGEDSDFHVIIDENNFSNLNARTSEPTPDTTGPGLKDMGHDLFPATNSVCDPILMQFTENVSTSALTTDSDVQLWMKVITSTSSGPWTKQSIAQISPSTAPNTYEVTPFSSLS
ncbi:MAG: Ig-like domain-containing protein, partial [Actinomycetota bacterium]